MQVSAVSLGIAFWVTACLVIGAPVLAQERAAEFFKNKTITMTIGADPGGTYDVPGRLLARYYPDHIPGSPRIVVQNMPGAGSAKAANYIYGVAAQDGTALVSLLNTIVLAERLGQVQIQADLAKLQWIGNMSKQAEVVVMWHTAPAHTIDDARKMKVIVGATSAGANTGMFPRILNKVLGTKFHLITGYGFASLDLAMERGEIHGQAGAAWMPRGKYADYVKDGKLRVLLQAGVRDPSLAGVPVLEDMIDKDSSAAQLVALFTSPVLLGKPTIAGPGVPKDRVEVLRKAYEATMANPAFRADAEKMGVPIFPATGVELEETVKRIAAMPDSLIVAAKAALEE